MPRPKSEKRGNQCRWECKKQSHKLKRNKCLQKKDKEWKKMPTKNNEPKHKQICKKTWHWCIHHMKWTVHMPKDYNLSKKQDQWTIKNQDNQLQVRANQVTYAKMPTKLAQLFVDEWWGAPAWLAHDFLAMTKSTTIALMQTIFLLTFPWGSTLFSPCSCFSPKNLTTKHPAKQNPLQTLPSPQFTDENIKQGMKKRGWETSLWEEKGTCQLRLSCFYGPLSWLVVTSRTSSATLTWRLDQHFSAALLQLRTWGKNQWEFLDLKQRESL